MRTSLSLLMLAAACAPQPNATSVSTFNHYVTSHRDGDLETCSHAGVDALLPHLDPAVSDGACAVAVATSAGVVYAAADGLAVDPTCDANAAADVALDAVFNLGSVSKTLTAVALLRLWELGELGTDGEGEPLPLAQIEVQDLIDLTGSDIPSYVRSASLHELLSHTAGIDDSTFQLWVGDAPGGGKELSGLNQPVRWDEVAPQLSLPPATDARLQALLGVGGGPGSAPELALYTLSGPDTGILGSLYSNVGYAVLAAIIDHVVTEPGFAHYGEAFGGPIVPGYETWVWWVWNATYAQEETPLSLALIHPWREAVGGIPALVPDYEIEGGVCAPGDWQYFGWESGAGGWTSTIGDLARIGLVIAERGILAPETWDLAMGSYGTVRGAPYGYGLQLPDGIPQLGDDVWQNDPEAPEPAEIRVGHGGQGGGYQAGVFSFEVEPAPLYPTPLVTAYACNTTDMGLAGLYEEGPRIVRDAWTDVSDVVCTFGVTPDQKLAEEWPDVEGEATLRLQRSTPDQVEADVRAELSRTLTGGLLLRAADTLDEDGTTLCALQHLGVRGAWGCP